MNILLLGDSVRMFYQKAVTEKLGDGYTVYAPPENCRFSAYVLNSLRLWFQDYPTPDIIHWNAGLWDTAILYKEDGCFTGLDQYLITMKKILRVLKSTGAKIIFATTTPVHDDKVDFEGPMPPAHDNKDIIRYNEAVKELFRDEDVIINDLFLAMYEERSRYLLSDMIHPDESGVELLSDRVVEAIKSVGVYNNPKNNEKKDVLKTEREEKTIQ